MTICMQGTRTASATSLTNQYAYPRETLAALATKSYAQASADTRKKVLKASFSTSMHY